MSSGGETHRITLLFNANKVYDRRVIQGIGEYLHGSESRWDVYLDEDFRYRERTLEVWAGDGIIADMDDPRIEEAVADLSFPVVGVGASYAGRDKYPPVPYVATDNDGIADVAFEHLKSKGLEHFAFYGLPESPFHRWAAERERAFVERVDRAGYRAAVYRGHLTRPDRWTEALEDLSHWLRSLPRPLGIMAVTDSRARHLLQVCRGPGMMVPDEVAVIGVDNDEVARFVSPVPLSSVEQATRDMGHRAARLLHRMLSGFQMKREPTVVPPVGVVARQSSDYQAAQDPDVIQALHFIRRQACRGIKVEHVLTFVGRSRSTLERRFRAERGHSIHHEIHNHRLEQACELLRATELPMAEVADRCGFPSVQYLYTVFKKHAGVTPLAFRRAVPPAGAP
ncbi:MAG: DNA-binding transcriptional regulator [Myxococcota bacterium]